VARLKAKFLYDDSLDVFGVHGVGGFVGTILVAVFGSHVFPGGLGEYEILPQLKIQVQAALYTIALSAVVSLILLYALEATIGLRVNADQELTGLDLADHGENAYNVG
jgi:Amt family ammonium transporter